MKLKHLLALFVIIASVTITSAQKKKDISSAEEMVKYNIANNKDDYKGLVVVYHYDVIQENPVKIQEFKNQLNNSFKGVIEVKTLQNGSKKSIYVSTNGTTENNPIFYNLLHMYSTIVKQGKREILLK